MLKHASNASGAGSTSTTGGGASNSNGQLRNGTSPGTQQQQQQQQQPRNIHMRPPQPLNISTLSTASLTNNLQTSITSASAATLNTSTANGGQRIPTTANLLNIAQSNSNGSVGNGAPASGTTTTGSSVTPITPIIPNGNAIGVASALGIGNNRHTYSNQHVTAANNNTNQSVNNPITANGTHHNDTTIKTNANHNNNYSNCQNFASPTPVPPPLATSIQRTYQKSLHGPGPREALTSLGLLCLVSLLFALLSLIFLLKISPTGRENSLARNSNEDFVVVYDVTLALCALSLSLNLCCLLVCAIQFLFAVKLLRSPMFDGRDNKYLEKSSVSRTCAVGGFFISIPIFLTGIILYTFNHFHSTPAIITSVLIGVGIVFCGCAMVHNVFVWQKEKTISYRSPPLFNMSMVSQQYQQMQQTQQAESIHAQTIGPVTPPVQFLNSHSLIQPSSFVQANNTASHYTLPIHCHSQQPHSPLRILQQHQHTNHFHQNPGASMTPVSPNHSHGSFNPLLAGAISSSFLMRPATATPPTPKPIGSNLTATLARATSPHGSISPAQGPTLDMSNITNVSLHELSTLV